MTERFELLEEVGHGAMGVVWKARDNERRKIVAIKMLRDVHLDDDEYVERFAGEGDLARSVRSPHVVRVRGYGVRRSVPFVVLEFVAGKSMRAQIIERGPFAPAQARDLLAQIAEALAAVHAVGIVHRDVKASNVLLTDDGTAKLTDFGIARGRDPRGSTQMGSLLGTPAYMAPEGPVDARSDLYSLGVLYYEMLAGVLPFNSTNYHEVIRAHVETMPDLTQLPAGERGVTGWMMSKKPSERPATAEVLLASLRSGGAGPIRTAVTGVATSDVGATGGLAPYPTVTSTTTRAPALPTSWPQNTTYPSTPQRGAAARAQPSPIAAIVMAVVAVLAIGAVVALAAFSGAPASGSGNAPSQASPADTATLLIAVLIIAVAAIAVTVALVMSRARGRATRH